MNYHRLQALWVALAAASGCAIEPSAGIDVAALPPPPADGKADSLTSFCPGLVEDFPSLDGLAGTYTRLAPFGDGEVASLQLGAAAGEGFGFGDYRALVLRDGLVQPERGAYMAAPDNAAIGAFIGFDPDADLEEPPATEDLEIEEVYWVAGARRALSGSYAGLCLVRYLVDSDSWAEPFALQRVGL